MNKSESINELAKALCQFQGEVQDVHKDKSGYGYKYADLSGVLEIVRPLCKKYGLCVSQLCENDPANPSIVGVRTTLIHSSGQWIESIFYMALEPKKNLSAAQSGGSVITYARRYALAAILGITQTDNDASVVTTATNQTPVHKPHFNSQGQLTKLNKLIYKLNISRDEVATWLKKANATVLKDLTEVQVSNLVTMLEGRERNGNSR